MKRTPRGTPVGTDDHRDVIDRCDWVTRDGLCRFALERPEHDPAFTAARLEDDYKCPFLDDDTAWTDCAHVRVTDRSRSCVRCGLEDRPMAHDPSATSLLHDHHVAYPEADDIEVTVRVCRWCHTKIHRQGVRLDDDAEPDPEAVAELERRIRTEREETFTPASEDRD